MFCWFCPNFSELCCCHLFLFVCSIIIKIYFYEVYKSFLLFLWRFYILSQLTYPLLLNLLLYLRYSSHTSHGSVSVHETGAASEQLHQLPLQSVRGEPNPFHHQLFFEETESDWTLPQYVHMKLAQRRKIAAHHSDTIFSWKWCLCIYSVLLVSAWRLWLLYMLNVFMNRWLENYLQTGRSTASIMEVLKCLQLFLVEGHGPKSSQQDSCRGWDPMVKVLAYDSLEL